MISPAEAEAAIRSHAPLLPAVSVPVAELAGTTLRERVVARLDQPPFDRVTMDGIAFAFAAYERGRRAFRIAGTQAAGAPRAKLASEDECFEVMTGAIVPEGCDCVVPVEQINVEGGVAYLSAEAVAERGLYIHARGIDSRRGDVLLEPGTVLGPAEVAVLASHGYTHATVTRKPRIAVISTGDELVEPGAPLEPWQIYRSNAYAILAELQRRGYDEVTLDHLPDDPDILRTRLEEHLATRDTLILSGGVSMGRFDHVPRVLTELSVSTLFHKVAQRPGKPLWFGLGLAGQTVYALPGNPVSTLVCLVRYVLAGLARSQGRALEPVPSALLDRSFEVKPALTLFVPASLRFEAGRCHATPRPTHGSGDFTSLIGTDGFVELPPGPRLVPQGTSVPLHCW
ncbi:MAG TPA: molybdopterin molybdotransferase MoeA [Steroidobacter sp.]